MNRTEWPERMRSLRRGPLLQGFDFRRRLELNADAEGGRHGGLARASGACERTVNGLSWLFVGALVISGTLLGAAGGACGWVAGQLSLHPEIAQRGRRLGAGIGAGLAIAAVGLPIVGLGYLMLGGLKGAAYVSRIASGRRRSLVTAAEPTSTHAPSAATPPAAHVAALRGPSLSLPPVSARQPARELER